MTDEFLPDYTGQAGAAALGARLRRLVDQIDGDTARIYRSFGVKFEQRWFGFINQIVLHGPMTVSEIAEALRITHVSTSQARKSLEDSGIISSTTDPKDGRRRLLELTPAGIQLVEELRPLWSALEAAAFELNRDAGNVLEAFDRLDTALGRRTMYDRITDQVDDTFSKSE